MARLLEGMQHGSRVRIIPVQRLALLRAVGDPHEEVGVMVLVDLLQANDHTHPLLERSRPILAARRLDPRDAVQPPLARRLV